MTADEVHGARLARDLAASSEVDPLDVRLAISAGVVTLTGEVGSAAERLAVRSIIWSDPATTAVVDELRVTQLPGAWRLSDDEVTALVLERLSAHPELARVHPSCDVHTVYLDGAVADPEHRRLAHHLARTTRGVHFVIDRIESDATPRTADAPAER